MKRIVAFISVFTLLLIASCSDFLDYTPRGKVSTEQINTPETIDQMVTAAYASIGNDDRTYNFTHLWIHGSVRADDSYKGGGGVNNRTNWHYYETFSGLLVDNAYLDDVWIALYEGIGRANEAIRRMDELTEAEYPNKTVRRAECFFIRGHFHFLLKIIHGMPVWVDHTIPKTEIKTHGNREYTKDEFWDLIAADFTYAASNLPESQSDIGRADKATAQAYLAKVRLFQAYQQDEQHNVTGIDTDNLQEVVTMCDNVINSGTHDLFDNFGKNFLFAYENGIESMFAVQFSGDDGVDYGRTNRASWMNFPMAPEYGCCWFHPPSQNLANAFQTDANGLPLFDTFNDVEMKDSADFVDNTFDPRLDFTIGIPGHPFKSIPTFIMQPGWARVPEVYGPFQTQKEVPEPDCGCIVKRGAYVGTSMNWPIIRYADVLLMKAEALIELGRETEALPIINMLRTRADNSKDWSVYADGSPVSNFLIAEYEDGVNCTWDQAFARNALRWERRLEFAMEGSRFFDLVRWGIAAETINAYLDVEKVRYEFLKDAVFTKGRDEYLPIAQSEINLVEGLYTQNNGW